MSFIKNEEIKYYSFDNLISHNVTQAIFTRRGGVSPEPWNGLNMGISVGDQRDNVIANRERVFEVMDRPIGSLSDSWLVHGKDVLEWEQPRSIGMDGSPKADIIITNNPEVTLFMRYADCVPVFIYDPINKAIALVHAGWKGTVQKVGKVAVDALSNRYGSDPKDLIAGIGPSISVEKYEVGKEVVDAVEASFSNRSAEVLIKFGMRYHFDLWSANQIVLQEAGVINIEISKLCTATNPNDWFSHRGENGKTGRFGAMIGLNS